MAMIIITVKTMPQVKRKLTLVSNYVVVVVVVLYKFEHFSIKAVVVITYYRARSDGRQLTRYVTLGQVRELAGPSAVT